MISRILPALALLLPFAAIAQAAPPPNPDKAIIDGGGGGGVISPTYSLPPWFPPEKQAEIDWLAGSEPEDSLTSEGPNDIADPVVTEHEVESFWVDQGPKIKLFSYAHQNQFGNDRFGVGYEVRTFAEVNRTSITADSQIKGWANAWGRLFGRQFNVLTIDSGATAVNRPNEQKAEATFNVMVLGKAVRRGDREAGAYRKKHMMLPEKTQEIAKNQATFSVWGIPVTVEAALNARESITLEGMVWIDELSAVITPSASLWVDAYAMAGIRGIIAGGVKGALGLVRLNLPVGAAAKWHFALDDGSGQCAAGLEGAGRVDFVGQSMMGTIGVCSEVLNKERCKKIADWKGVVRTWPLVSFSGVRTLPAGRCLPQAGTAPERS